MKPEPAIPHFVFLLPILIFDIESCINNHVDRLKDDPDDEVVRQLAEEKEREVLVAGNKIKGQLEINKHE